MGINEITDNGNGDGIKLFAKKENFSFTLFCKYIFISNIKYKIYLVGTLFSVVEIAKIAP